MTPTNPMDRALPRVREYLKTADFSACPGLSGRPFSVSPLAQGEYNLNFLMKPKDEPDKGRFYVFRVNAGTQIGRDDQITYEFKALKLLEKSGRTPCPVYVDDTRRFFDTGILIMTHLPGGPMDYHRDCPAAARLFADIHGVKVDPADNHLIAEDAPLTLIYTECARLLSTYFTSPLADPDIRTYLRDLLAWADDQRKKEVYFSRDPVNCVVNTEVNSGNFIVDRKAGKLYLVDWEMPRWGDPSTDLCHFLSPLTTLWKTDFRMDTPGRAAFLGEYKRRVADPHLRDTLDERMALKDPFVHLRGISWSAMGWTAYRTNFDGVKNPDTFATLNRYMDLSFIRSLFDPFMKKG